MAITSSSQLIDVQTIEKGCELIDKAANDFITCSKYVLESSQICNNKALEVDGKTMSPSLEELALAIDLVQKNIIHFTENIRDAASEIYRTQYIELKNYEESLKQETTQV